jgi:hypothetical protein
MKLLGSLIIAFSVFAAPAFAHNHMKDDKAHAAKDGKTCDCAAGKCDGSCKHTEDKDGHTCTGGDSCKDHSHKDHAAPAKKEKKG